MSEPSYMMDSSDGFQPKFDVTGWCLHIQQQNIFTPGLVAVLGLMRSVNVYNFDHPPSVTTLALVCVL
jgi:hypothetical protein